jgi:hypothetical protein
MNSIDLTPADPQQLELNLRVLVYLSPLRGVTVEELLNR